MKFTIFHESRIGRRKLNQDRMDYAYTRDALLLVVADGMGGHAHGEVAAQITVDTLSEAFKAQARSTLADPFMFLSRTLSQAHLAINRHVGAADLESAPRTTCVACIVQHNVAYWAHVGDSRLYVIREGQTLAQTRDHSHVRLLIEQGTLSEAEAAHHPSRNLVYSCLGGPNPPEVEFSRKTSLLRGDVIALCTDGAWAPFSDNTLVRTLALLAPQEAVPQLLDQAEQLAGRHCDNLTLMALRWNSGNGETSSTNGLDPAALAPSQPDLPQGQDSPLNPDSVMAVPLKKPPTP